MRIRCPKCKQSLRVGIEAKDEADGSGGLLASLARNWGRLALAGVALVVMVVLVRQALSR